MKPLLTLREAASYLRISEDWAQRLARAGELPGAFRPNGSGDWRVDPDRLEQWVKESAA